MGILQNSRNIRHYLKLYQRFSTSQKLKADVTVKPGDRLHGYIVEQVTAVPDFYLTAVQLTHEASGAQHLHMSRDDRNNVFGVAFRTTPMDSTGVAHILEHTVLCGSQRFPVRDPFFKMLNRSLSTFMNAFTASDWTMYPFSTQNPQDYENLLAVYLDAAFLPRLNEMDFRQEGWRLENEDLQNAESPLVFKGVVYNEMKGVFSNSEHHFAQRVQNLLLPSHTYGHVSGGDPLAIPDLSWQQLRDFHASHYHPSNARFFTYGNFPLERHLELINELALSKFTRLQMDTAVPSEPRWSQPRESRTTCQPDPLAPYPEKQTTIAVSYVLADVADSYEGFVLSLLGALLTQGEKAPFYRSLLEANIGSNFAPTHGYSGDTKDSTFSIGLKGIHPDDTEKVKTIIQETFEQVVREGFEQDRIDAILHQIELGLKHQTAHFGLNMGVAVISVGNNEGDPIEAIRISEQTERFIQDLKDNPRFLQDKVQQYFLDNPHKLTLVMSPHADHDKLIQEQEAQRLSGMVDSLTAEDKELIYKQGLELAELQAQEEDISCLPSLKVSDIEKECETVDTDHVYVDGTTVQLCEQPTNGVTYFRCLSNIADLPEELKYYVPLFCQVVSKMGAGDKDFREMSQEIELKTGGLGVGVHLVDHHTDPALFEQGILFSSHCLDRNLGSMLNLWSDIFNSVDMSDEGRLMTLIQMTAAEMASSIADRGHVFAMTHAASSLSASSQLNEIFSGMTQVSVMKNVAEMKDLTPVVSKLKEIGSHILNRQHVRCSLNATPESMDGAVKQVESFLHQLRVPKRVTKQPSDYKSVPTFQSSQQQVQFELPFQVNYISRGVKTASYTDPDFASLRILSRLITAKYLHREIREKGGAYGGGARGDVSGLFSFYSYRDPNSSKTVAAFDGATQWASDGSFSQQDIDEAKLSVFSQVDAPEPPGRKGQRVFLHGITDEMKQQHRGQLFQVSKDDLVNVASKYLTPAVRTSSVTLLGPENSMCQQDHWTIKKQ